MSKINLAPDASGTGIFTIASPNSNTNRTLTLPDDTGTIVTNSGNQAGSFTTLNTSGAVVFNDAGADVDFRVEGDTDANLLFVDASADAVGIGTNAPTTVSGFRVLEVAGSTNGGFIRTTDGTVVNSIYQASGAGYTGTQSSHALGFVTAGAERARITSGGYFKASNTGNYYNATAEVHEMIASVVGGVIVIFQNSSATPYGQYIEFSGATPNNTTNYFLSCHDTTNEKAVIWSSGTFGSRSNVYGGISDVKVKQDIVDANSQWDDIKGLRIRKFRMKDEVAADPNYPAHIGLIAQEAELVSPGLVFESPDFEEVEVPVLDDNGNAVLNEDGTPQVTKQRNDLGTVTKSVKYSILYMKAVKALQEAMERIETLEAKVAALEANNGV